MDSAEPPMGRHRKITTCSRHDERRRGWNRRTRATVSQDDSSTRYRFEATACNGATRNIALPKRGVSSERTDRSTLDVPSPHRQQDGRGARPTSRRGQHARRPAWRGVTGRRSSERAEQDYSTFGADPPFRQSSGVVIWVCGEGPLAAAALSPGEVVDRSGGRTGDEHEGSSPSGGPRRRACTGRRCQKRPAQARRLVLLTSSLPASCTWRGLLGHVFRVRSPRWPQGCGRRSRLWLFGGWFDGREGWDFFGHFEEFVGWFGWGAEFECSAEGVGSGLGSFENGSEAVVDVSDVREVEDEVGVALAVDEVGDDAVELSAGGRVEFMVGSDDGGSGDANGHQVVCFWVQVCSDLRVALISSRWKARVAWSVCLGCLVRVSADSRAVAGTLGIEVLSGPTVTSPALASPSRTGLVGCGC